MAKDDELNAKNLPFDQPGYGLALGGVTAGNVYKKYDKLRAARDEKAGGSKQLWENLSRWTSTKQGANLNPDQAKLFNQYIQTGKKPTGLKDETTLAAMDWGLREAGRFQQHKPVSLLSQIAGPLLTIGAGFIPVIGPYAAAATGGYFGQRNGGGVLGGLLGAAGGYLGGRGIQNAGGASGIYNSAKNGLHNLLGGGGFSNPAGLGLSGSNLGLDFASGGFPAAPVTGYGASALGLTGDSVSSALGGLGTLGGPSAAELGNQAIGGDPSSLYNPASLGPPKPGSSTADRVVRAARTGLGILDSLGDPPSGGGTLMSAGPVGQPAQQIIPHGVQMRPLLPYQYFRPNTNPFMARIV